MVLTVGALVQACVLLSLFGPVHRQCFAGFLAAWSCSRAPGMRQKRYPTLSVGAWHDP